MTYEPKNIRRQKIRYDSLNEDVPLVYQFSPKGIKLTPDTGTAEITITNTAGTVILEEAAMTIDGTLVTFCVDATDTSDYTEGHGYRADIKIEVSSVPHEGHFIFDVVKKLLNIGVTRDTLSARDSHIQGSEHAGYENLAPFIEACRDEIQLMLEAKASSDEQLFEEMVIDPSRIAIPTRIYILWMHHADIQADGAKAEHYEKTFERLWSAYKNAVRYDNGGQQEETTQRTVVVQRLIV